MEKLECRSCNYAKYSVEYTRHTPLLEKEMCPVCLTLNSFIFHNEEEFCGESIDCSNCHNYIYYTESSKRWKDEIYFTDRSLLIRDFEDNKSFFYIDFYIENLSMITFESIIDFSNMNNLCHRLKSLMVFL